MSNSYLSQDEVILTAGVKMDCKSYFLMSMIDLDKYAASQRAITEMHLHRHNKSGDAKKIALTLVLPFHFL